MMWCCTLALNGILPAGLGETSFINHGIEHSLSAIYDIPHGAGLAIVTPAWFEWKRARGLEPRLARFAREVFRVNEPQDSKAAIICVDRFRQWCAGMGVPVRLSQMNIPSEGIPEIAANAMGLFKLWGIEGYSQKNIEEILTLAK